MHRVRGGVRARPGHHGGAVTDRLDGRREELQALLVAQGRSLAGCSGYDDPVGAVVDEMGAEALEAFDADRAVPAERRHDRGQDLAEHASILRRARRSRRRRSGQSRQGGFGFFGRTAPAGPARGGRKYHARAMRQSCDGVMTAPFGRQSSARQRSTYSSDRKASIVAQAKPMFSHQRRAGTEELHDGIDGLELAPCHTKVELLTWSGHDVWTTPSVPINARTPKPSQAQFPQQDRPSSVTTRKRVGTDERMRHPDVHCSGGKHEEPLFLEAPEVAIASSVATPSAWAISSASVAARRR